MGILSWIREKRSTPVNSHDESFWRSLFPSVSSKAGVNVTSETALRTSTVYACVRVLAESVASLPITVFKRDEDGDKEPAKDHSLHRLLHDTPNELQTSFEFRELMMTRLNLKGNYYAFKETNNAGRIANLVPLNPDRVEVKGSDENGNREIIYEFTPPGSKTIVIPSDEMWHIPALSTNGVTGISPITVARDAIGLAIATEEHGSKLFANEARPSIVLQTDGELSIDGQKRLKTTWDEAFKGSSNSWKTVVLEEGLKVQPLGFTNEDSQFLETRNFQVSDIARIFRVPAVMIGHPDTTMTFASAEQFFLSFVVHTLRPWLVRIEQSANMHLLTEKERAEGFFVEFTIDGLLRGDIKSRFEAYAMGRQNTWLSANDVRRLENMNRVEGGDVYENPNIAVTEELTEIPEE